MPNERFECPECGEVRNGSVTEATLYHGPHIYRRGDRQEDDILICLGCGHLHKRDGSAVFPGGIADFRMVP